MNYKIQAHLMMLVSFMLCNTSSMVLAAATAITAEEEMNMPRESVFSTALRFEGDVVEMLPSGKAMRETAILRCKRFEWLGKAEKGTTEEERLNTVDRAPEIDAISVDELPENLRGTVFFNGH